MKRPKYNNKKVSLDCFTFDSKREARRYLELKALQESGKIHGLKLQVVFKFPINGIEVRYVDSNRVMKYIADFEYFNSEGVRIVEDVKGVKTPDYKIKKALMMACHEIFVEEV